MKYVKVLCRGASPLLMDRMTDATLEGLRTGVYPAINRERPASATASEKIYRENGESGKIGLPSEMLFSCLVNAGRNVKMGRKGISTATTTTLPEILAIQEPFLPFRNIDPAKESEAWVVDKRRGRLKDAKGTAVCVVRPKFNAWEFEVTVAINDGKMGVDKIRELFDSAGSSQGLGSFRPNCRGPFGRFIVAEWQEMKEALPKAAA